VLLLIAMLGTLGTLFGVPAASASVVQVPAAGSATPPVPTSTITPNPDPGTVTYCVDNYLGNSDVSVANNANQAIGTIHTDANGHGCTQMPVKTTCSQPVSNTIVASGLDQANQPATSQATYNTLPDPSQCPGGGGSPTPNPTSTSTSTASPSPSPTDTCDPTQATLSITVTPQGGTIEALACGFLPGETVDAFAHSKPVYLGTTTAHSDGTVDATYKLPMAVKPGAHIWTYVGRTSGHTASAPFRVTSVVTGNGGGQLPGEGNGGGPGTGSNSPGGGGLAFTGAWIATMVLVALVLLAVGTLTVITVRRRRAEPVAPAGSA
jgi:hypothetical protein